MTAPRRNRGSLALLLTCAKKQLILFFAMAFLECPVSPSLYIARPSRPRFKVPQSYGDRLGAERGEAAQPSARRTRRHF